MFYVYDIKIFLNTIENNKIKYNRIVEPRTKF